MGKDDLRDPFARTQAVNLAGQLVCGARALDVRVVLDHDGKIRYHHGSGLPSWISDQTLDDTLPDLVRWSAEHPTELALLMLSHCYTRTELDLKWTPLDCRDSRVLAGFSAHGLAVQTDCDA